MEFRTCEHCGCNTNAFQRRCCIAGEVDDRTKKISPNHLKFYWHLKNGGRIYRNDVRNNEYQILTLEKLGNNANLIGSFGYQDLHIILE